MNDEKCFVEFQAQRSGIQTLLIYSRNTKKEKSLKINVESVS